MIVPSIDLMGGQAVQLIGGEKKAIEAGPPLPIAKRFAVAGDIAVIDLDAALGRGDNTDTAREIIRRYPCRFGGGIRDLDTAIEWLDAGASKIILGTAAVPELLAQLPRERVIAALDTRHGEVVVEGWRKATGREAIEQITHLKEFVGGFLVTFVEREGRMKGIDLAAVAKVVEAAAPVKVTVAGGVTTTEEIAEIDRLGADVQVGMALYSGVLDLADGLVAPIVSDRKDGLWSTVIVDENGQTLGLAYSNIESIREAVRTRTGVYHSRKRGLWVKGKTSGNTQQLLRVELDCDRDALRFTVRQRGKGFCHKDTYTCWGEDSGIFHLARLLQSRVASAPAGSYTRRLLDEPSLLAAKIREEADELARAKTPGEVIHEAADVIYFTLTALARAGVDLCDVEQELARRNRKVTRRPGDAKPQTEVIQ